jgi:OOP family OmpA-OmpF porin
MMKKLHVLCLASLAALGSTPALSQNAQHFYGGAGLGQSRSSIDDNRINAALIGAGATSTSISHDQQDASYKVFGGYQFTPYFGMEVGYFNLGEFGFKSTSTPTGTLDGRIKLTGTNIDLVGSMPMNDQLSFIARIGVHNARAQDTFTSTGNVQLTNPNPEKRETNYKAGFGFAYKFSPSMSLRGELERYRVNDAVGSKGDINMASLSLVFPFGHTPAPAPKVVERVVYREAPAAVVAAAPVVVAAPPAEAPKAERLRVSFNADVLFGFDRAIVSPSGKLALDKFTAELSGVEYDHVTIEGHTDRIGTQAYNEKLSLQRADAVKTYLVSRGAVPASKITTVGKGSTQPLTDVGACKGIATSAAVIACLEPDRRVDLDVMGTKPAKK